MKCSYSECNKSISQSKLSDNSNSGGFQCPECKKTQYCSEKCLKMDRYFLFPYPKIFICFLDRNIKKIAHLQN